MTSCIFEADVIGIFRRKIGTDIKITILADINCSLDSKFIDFNF